MRIRRLAAALGAEVLDVDVRTLDDDAFATVRRALLDHGVICVRDQHELSPDDQLAFASRWGEIAIHPYIPSIEGHPGIMRIHDPNPITQTWHSDTTHMAEPPALTILLARTLPPVGGDTMWASTTRVVDQLSPGLRSVLAGLRAVHRGTERAADAGLDAEAVTTTHPVLRTHPETGDPSLFVNANYVTELEGWTAAESAPLLAFLYDLVGRPENTYRHRWCPGDLVVWDNRSTQHAVVGDTAGAERTLHRVTIAGDRPV